jgi:hypothetical protein
MQALSDADRTTALEIDISGHCAAALVATVVNADLPPLCSARHGQTSDPPPGLLPGDRLIVVTSFFRELCLIRK